MKMENKINEERVGNQHYAKRENKETFRETERTREKTGPGYRFIFPRSFTFQIVCLFPTTWLDIVLSIFLHDEHFSFLRMNAVFLLEMFVSQSRSY